MRKKLIITLCILVLQIQLFAVTKIWLGTGPNKKWNTAANWSPSGVPATGDDVVVNISDSIDVDFIGSSITVKSIKISNNATVVFSLNVTGSVGLVRTMIMSSTSTSVYGCEIETGCHLKINTSFTNTGISGTPSVNFVFSLTGNAGVTGLINGTISFSGYVNNVSTGTGASQNRFETFLGAAAFANCNIYGTIRYNSNSGNTTTSSTSLTMRNGSFYEINKNGGTVPACTWETNSTLVLLGITSTLPSFSTTNLGNFIYDCPNQSTNLSFSDNLTFNNVSIVNTSSNSSIGINIANNPTANRTWTVNGNFTTNANTLFRIINTNVTTGSGTLNLRGNFINNGTFTAVNTNGANANFNLIGTNFQSISGAGTIDGVVRTNFNNPAGFQILNDITWGGSSFDLTQGIVNTNNFTFTIPYTNLLNTAAPSTTYNNLIAAGFSRFGAENAYFIGKLQRSNISSATPVDISFPVGSVSLHRPIFIKATSDSYTVEYKRVNPWTLGIAMQAGLDHTSSLEYWEITSSGTAAASVGLTWYDPNSGGVSNLATLRVARFNGVQWNNEGSNNIVGTAGSNGIIFSNSINAFGPFTLASTNFENPLPFVDIKLQLIKNANTTQLKWTTSDDSEIESYQVQSKLPDGQYKNLATVIPNRLNNNQQYHFQISNNNQLTQYRIKANSFSGTIAYSNIVLFSPRSTSDFVLFGNSIQNSVGYHNKIQNAVLTIVDANGRQLIQQRIMNGFGSTNIQHLPAGLYYLQITQFGKNVSTHKLVKQ